MDKKQKEAHLRMLATSAVTTHSSLTRYDLKNGRRHFPESLVDEWVELKRQGKTGAEIAPMYGVSKNTINLHCKRRKK